MHSNSRPRAAAWALAALTALNTGFAAAQAPAAAVSSLTQAFEAAWQRQPEAASQTARREAADAALRAASSWTADAPALDAAAKSDRLNGNDGIREYGLAVSVPLWLPGERARSGALAEAEAATLDAKLHAARWRLAAQVREAWWTLQSTRVDEQSARERLAHARQLAADVARRVDAGELARADRFQSDSVVAQSEAALAEATLAAQSASLALRALSGTSSAPGTPAVGAPGVGAGEPLPPPAQIEIEANHPAIAELRARAALGERSAELAATRTRANPELLLATTRERDQFGEAYRQSITVGVRLPFGAGSRADAKIAAARADALEAQGQLALERAKWQSEIDIARARLDAARKRLQATVQQRRLTSELRGFYDKAFRLGEADLPTRLRVEFEAASAEQQAARAQIDAAAAVSALRQALGLLPE